MRYRVLGPLEVQDDDRAVPLSQGRQRLLLAVLLVHANETLSTDRLIDELWGETPPPTAGRSLHNLVSALRKALGNGQVVTRGRGYALTVVEGELDAERFEAMVRRGRAALAAGEPDRAAVLLGEALALWRGAPFGDLAYHPALAGEAARLDEARLAALEDRIDADLARGGHVDVLAEVNALTGSHPLRERLRGQQMLALYHSGRQAEALEAYRDARQRLTEELGIEPGPGLRRVHQAILDHDPELGVPDRLPARPPAVGWVRRHARPLVVAVGLLAAAAAVALVAMRGGEPRAAGEHRSDFIAAIDPASNRVVDRLPVGKRPTVVALGAGAAWTVNADARSLSRVDLRTRTVKTIPTGTVPLDLAVSDEAAWLVGSQRKARDGFMTPPDALTRLDPGTGAAAGVNQPLRPSAGTFRWGPQLAAVDGRAVWAIGRAGRLLRFDTRSGRERVVESVDALNVAAGYGQVWVLVRRPPDQPEGPNLVRLDPRTARVLTRVAVPSESIGALAVSAGSVWLTDDAAGGVWRVGRAGRSKPRIIAVEPGVDGIAAADGSVWTISTLAGTVARIDPGSERVVARLRVGGAPGGIAVGGGRVWVTVTDDRARAVSDGDGVAPVASSQLRIRGQRRQRGA